jgi:hypothetical protein
MIYTRFGSPVTIIGRDSVGEWLRVRYQDGATRDVHFNDLRADGGVTEIVRDMRAAPERITTNADEQS